jgi:hypothetical protein
VVSGRLREGIEADVYLAALVAGSVAAMLVGLVVLLLIARAPAPGALIGISLAAVTTDIWLGSFGGPVGLPDDTPDLISSSVLRWAPAVVVGLAVAWCGLRTAGRVVAAIVSLLVLWVGPALFTASSMAAGTRVLARHPAEMADFAVQVFLGALVVPGGSWRLVVVALVIAILGLVGAGLLRRRSTPMASG